MDATCYAYDPASGEYLGEAQGDPSPLEPGAYLFPAHTTLTMPPAAPAGQRQVWRGSAWALVPDHRGETWYGADGTAVIVGRLGDPAAFTPPLSAGPPAPNATDLAAYTTAAHAALRDGGVTVGGLRIKTDAESRGLIDGAYALSTAQPDTSIDFKSASGWATIDAATMQTVAVAVGKWVQACYSAYRAVDSKVTDGTFTTTGQIDAAFAAVTLPA